jgi:predicted dehydrogenase/nucleoside-diphosphate-sugar epimerase
MTKKLILTKESRSFDQRYSLKIGIVGCGGIANMHIKYISQYITKEKIAVCDKDAVRLADFSKNHGIVNSFLDLELMLGSFKPDVVHISTPPASHKDLAIKCLLGGAHVFLEKPMCISSEEADEIKKAADISKKLVTVDHMRSLDPQIIKAKELLKSGKLGRVVNINACYSHDMLVNKKFVGNRWVSQLPGGMLFDIAPHILYLVQDFIPDVEAKNVVCIKNKDGVVTDMTAMLQGKESSATVNLSLNIFPLQNYIELYCSSGYIKIDLRNFVNTVNVKTGLPNFLERITGNWSMGIQYAGSAIGIVLKFLTGRLDPYIGLDSIIRSFYKSILDKTEPPISIEQGRKLAVIMDKIFASVPSLPNEVEKTGAVDNEADVLVTGGSGLIGSRLVERLLSRGYSVRVMAHNTSIKGKLTKEKGKLEIVKGDVYRYGDVEMASRGVKTIYHLAAAMKGDWNYNLDTTVTGTKNIFEAALKNGVKEIIYTSTLNVYDAKKYPNKKHIDETFGYEDHPEKRGAYSQAKLMAEKLVLDFAKNNAEKLSVTVLRPGLVYGASQNIFPQDIGIKIGKKIAIIIGLGYRKIPFVHVDNVVDALMLAKGKRQTGVFNVVDEEYPSQRGYIRLYNKKAAVKITPIYIPFCVFILSFWTIEKMVRLLLKKDASLVYKLKCVSRSPVHSTDAIRDRLGWKQNMSFESGIEKMLSDKV